MPHNTRLTQTYGRNANDRSEECTNPTLEGAHAALESFYHAFNTGNANLLRSVWVPDDLVRLKNPLGGVVEGLDDIAALYGRIFNGPATVWVELSDITMYATAEAVAFSGRETGEFTNASRTINLEIRTTRVLHYVDGRWGRVHHHGSITDPERLNAYQQAVLG